MRVRLLAGGGCTHDKQETATKTVMEQAELIRAEWAAGGVRLP